jgi:hypothetical protein
LTFGRRIPREYITDLVVFPDADVHALTLTDSDKARTLDRPGLTAALRTRFDFAINSGVLDREEIEGMASVLRTIDRSDTPEATARHARMLHPPKWYALRRRRREVEVGLSNQVLGVAPVAPRLTGERYPDLATPLPPKRSPIGGIAALLLVAVIAVWLFVFGGYALVNQGLAGLLNAAPTPAPAPAQQAAPPAHAQPSESPVSVQTAKQTLQEILPAVYAELENPDAPVIDVSGDLTTFTWRYVARSGAGEPQVRAVSLIIRANGQVMGMSTGG